MKKIEYPFKKTLIKNINSGDIFTFLTDNGYRYGRIINRTVLGFFVILFKNKSDELIVDQDFDSMPYYFPPIIIDGISIFQMNPEKDFAIIKKDPSYEIPPSIKDFKIIIGVRDEQEFNTTNNLQTVNCFGEVKNIAGQENIQQLQNFCVSSLIHGNDHVIEHIHDMDNQIYHFHLYGKYSKS